MKRLVPAIAALALIAACDAKIGKEADSGNSAATGSPEGKSKEGQFSIRTPGFDMKIDIPKGIADHASFDTDHEIVYPGATFSGIHIEGADHHGGVEIRYNSPDAPDKVAAWYQDPARAKDFTIKSADRQGAGYRLAGMQTHDNDPFTLELSPRAGGGTDGRLALTDRD